MSLQAGALLLVVSGSDMARRRKGPCADENFYIDVGAVEVNIKS